MDWNSVIVLMGLTGLTVFSSFFRLSEIVWTLLFAAVLILFTYLGYFSVLSCLLFVFLFILIAGFANLHYLRQKYVTQKLLPYLKKRLPPISDTERMAIEAGDTWWEKELFCGNPDWRQLYYFPQPILTLAEQTFLKNQVEKLCGMLNDWDIVYTLQDLPQDVWTYLKTEKFFGLVIPKEYGGLGFSALAHSTIIAKISTCSMSTAVTTMVPNSLGPAELLLHYGTAEQKNYYLPRLADGLDIPCFALTAPEAGSDAGAIPDKGFVCKQQIDGQEVIGIRLTWDKRYITLAPVATLLGLAFHLFDPEHLLGEIEDIGITLCLLPTSHPGVEIGNRHLPMQLAFMNGTTRGQDVFIPLDWIIGGKAMVGQGWRMLMECLSIGRSISLPALATGASKLVYRLTGAYASIRQQFNLPIGKFEGVMEALGHIGGNLYISEATRLLTANAIDQSINPAIISAITKYQLTELNRETLNYAMDIHAGHAIQAGPKNLLTNIYHAVPISITVEGANILTRNLIIFGQGAIRCHPYLLKEIELLSETNPSVASFDRVIMQHVGYLIHLAVRNICYGLTGGRFIFAVTKDARIKRYERQFKRMSCALALFSDISLITLGGALKRKERLSARFADILGQLYLGSAVLKYFHDQGNPKEDIPYVIWSLEKCLANMQIAFDGLFENFPKFYLGKLLKWIIFPYGRSFFPPKDGLHHDVANALLQPSTLRDRLTQYCYLSQNKDNLLFCADKALKEVEKIRPLIKKIQEAIKQKYISNYLDFPKQVASAIDLHIITDDEGDCLMNYEQLRLELIKVSEFTFDLEKII